MGITLTFIGQRWRLGDGFTDPTITLRVALRVVLLLYQRQSVAVYNEGFRVHELGVRVWDSGFNIKGSGP